MRSCALSKRGPIFFDDIRPEVLLGRDLSGNTGCELSGKTLLSLPGLNSMAACAKLLLDEVIALFFLRITVIENADRKPFPLDFQRAWRERAQKNTVVHLFLFK